MGGSEDQEAATPEAAPLKLTADVEVLPARVMLDDASRWARSLDGDAYKHEDKVEEDGAEEDEDPDLVGICQICMDVVPKRQVVTRVCGAECLAEVCAQCLVQHVIATVYSFYPGVLPKVRCPICLSLLNKKQWQHFAVPALKEHAEENQPQTEQQQTEPPAENEEAENEEADPAETEPAAGRGSDSTATADGDSDASVNDGSSESEANEATPSTSEVIPSEADDASAPEPVTSSVDAPDAGADASTNSLADAAVETQINADAMTETSTPAPAPADEWVDDNAHVLDKFEMLCRQSCGFQSPCCHNTDYTMLPPTLTPKQATRVVLSLTPEQEAALPALLSLCRDYCFHRVEAATVYDRLVDVFAASAEDVLALLLPRIADEERRATLLLHQLFLYPNAVTRCCNEPVCFKCKASDHHDGDCNDFVEEESVLECRGCHVTLVKVDGCDTVACLCGYSFSWQAEVDQRRVQRRQLAPSGDREFVSWQRWHRRLAASFGKIDSVQETMRAVRLARMLRTHRALLQRALLPRVLRKRQQLKQQQAVAEPEAVEAEPSAVEVAP